jgi:hypothetical protein
MPTARGDRAVKRILHGTGFEGGIDGSFRDGTSEIRSKDQAARRGRASPDGYHLTTHMERLE